MYDAELVSTSLSTSTTTSSASILSSNTNRVYTRSATANVNTDLNKTVGSDGSFHGGRSSRNSSFTNHKHSPISIRSELIPNTSDLENEFNELCDLENNGNENIAIKAATNHYLSKSR